MVAWEEMSIKFPRMGRNESKVPTTSPPMGRYEAKVPTHGWLAFHNS
tara:strand:+ start:977 stop:1117 length:141 start_codon:yes stop_codon:yes gene_type:complete